MPTSTRIINQENVLTSMSKRIERPLDCFGFKLSKGFPLSEVKGMWYIVIRQLSCHVTRQDGFF